MSVTPSTTTKATTKMEIRRGKLESQIFIYIYTYKIHILESYILYSVEMGENRKFPLLLCHHLYDGNGHGNENWTWAAPNIKRIVVIEIICFRRKRIVLVYTLLENAINKSITVCGRSETFYTSLLSPKKSTRNNFYAFSNETSSSKWGISSETRELSHSFDLLSNSCPSDYFKYPLLTLESLPLLSFHSILPISRYKAFRFNENLLEILSKAGDNNNYNLFPKWKKG